MKKHYVSSVLLVCTFVCFLSSQSSAQIRPIERDSIVTNIVGGTNTNISAVRWQVLVEVNGSDACGGTIIAPNWILTACHCLEAFGGAQYQANQIKVYAGVTNRSQKTLGQVRSVTQIIRHGGWLWTGNTLANDIALLRLSAPLTFNTNVAGIRYASANDAGSGFTNPGINTIISGWGFLSTGGPQPNHLQSANVPIRDINTLNQNQYQYTLVPANMIAGGVNGRGICHGDSGGPMVVTVAGIPILVGIASFRSNAGCANSNNPEIFTRVSNYCDWISDRVAAIEGPNPLGIITVCTSNSTINLRHAPAGANVTWSVTPASRFTPSSGTGTAATFRATNNNSGTGTITFTATGGCGTTTVSRNLNINISPVRMPQTTYPGPYATIYAEVDPVPGATSYEWYLNGQFQQISSYNHEFVVDNCDNYSTSVRAFTPTCGWTGLTTIYFSVVCSGSFAVYPNPADDYLTVELTDSTTVSSVTTDRSPSYGEVTNLQSFFLKNSIDQTDASSFSIEVYNKNQKAVAKANSANGKVVLDTRSYPKGTYFIHIYYKESVIQKQVLIE